MVGGCAVRGVGGWLFGNVWVLDGSIDRSISKFVIVYRHILYLMHSTNYAGHRERSKP